MGKPICIIGGSKGGVGKSIVTMAAIDYLQSANEQVMLIDTDTSNPDVWKAYKESVESELINLDETDGWIYLVNLLESKQDKTFVINSASRSNNAVSRYGGILSNALDELQRELITLWVINRQRDSLELLRQYLDAMPKSRIHVLRNLYFGEERKFELYNNSKIKTFIEAERGGKSLNFPDLADRVADEIYSKRMSISEALSAMPLGNRAEMMRWRSEVKKVLDEVFSK